MDWRRTIVTWTAVLAAIWAIPASIQSAEMESCLVSVVRITGQPKGGRPDSKLSVDIVIGKRRLFQTDWRPVAKAKFGNRITFKTAKSIPVRFLVRLWTPASSGKSGAAGADDGRSPRVVYYGDALPRPEPRQNDVLSTGFDGLIGDYDLSGGDVVARADSVAVRAEKSRAGGAGAASGGGSAGGVASEVAGRKGHETVLCETEIAWPPTDGTHLLECGGATLEILTDMLVMKRGAGDAKRRAD